MQLSEFEHLIEGLEYPTSTEEIVADHGSSELALQSGAETVEDVLSRCGAESFAAPGEVRMTLYGSLCDDAIGRKGYADRDPPMTGEFDPVSF